MEPVHVLLRWPSELSLLTLAARPAGSVACDLCGRLYSSANSMQLHREVHMGQTVCPLAGCGRVCGRVHDLRRHLDHVHRLSRQQILSMVPLREGGRKSQYSTWPGRRPGCLQDRDDWGVQETQLKNLRSVKHMPPPICGHIVESPHRSCSLFLPVQFIVKKSFTP